MTAKKATVVDVKRPIIETQLNQSDIISLGVTEALDEIQKRKAAVDKELTKVRKEKITKRNELKKYYKDCLDKKVDKEKITKAWETFIKVFKGPKYTKNLSTEVVVEDRYISTNENCLPKDLERDIEVKIGVKAELGNNRNRTTEQMNTSESVKLTKIEIKKIQSLKDAVDSQEEIENNLSNESNRLHQALNNPMGIERKFRAQMTKSVLCRSDEGREVLDNINVGKIVENILGDQKALA